MTPASTALVLALLSLILMNQAKARVDDSSILLWGCFTVWWLGVWAVAVLEAAFA